MTEDELLISIVKDRAIECEKNSIITHTDFWNLKKQSLAVNTLKKIKDVKWILNGGYEDAEKKMVIFLPFYIDDFNSFLKESPDSLPFVLIRADKDDFSTLSHRDYLGALMGLGIKREKIGDIIADEKGCFFFAVKSVAKYICENFTSAGKATIKAYEAKDNVSLSAGVNTQESCCFVASMRLDSVLCAIFSLSRSKASILIEKGLAFVNDEQILKPDFKMKNGDKIVLKGSGRAVIKDDSSKSKKGRIMLVVDVFK